jgi:hypothetical protein
MNGMMDACRYLKLQSTFTAEDSSISSFTFTAELSFLFL